MIPLRRKATPFETTTEFGAQSWRVYTRRSVFTVPGLAGPLRGLESSDSTPRTRVEMPTGLIDLVFVFNGKLTAGPATAGASMTRYTGVIGGPRTDAAVLEHGEIGCVTVTMRPTLAARVLDVPLAELADTAVDPVDLFGTPAARLISRLGDAADWDSRFTLVDRFLMQRYEAGTPVPAQVENALRRVVSPETPRPHVLAAEVGWSSRHMRRQFLRYVGLPPQKVAMIARLQRALHMGLGEQLAAVAHRAGYHDQAHLVRDLSRFCGMTPTRYRAKRFCGESRSVLIDRLPGYVTGVSGQAAPCPFHTSDPAIDEEY